MGLVELPAHDDRGLAQALIGDGRPLLLFTGLGLVLSGGLGLFLAATRQFLPHDIRFLGMTADELCAVNDCRVVHFMVHDRVAFSGAVIAIGVLYLWLAEFPLRRGEAWAWWALAVSGLWGFGSFLAYLGYGYLDTWHGLATLVLLPCVVGGLWRSFAPFPSQIDLSSTVRAANATPWRSPLGVGRLCLLATGLGMIAGGLTVTVVGMTSVFVPQDLGFIGLERHAFHGINPRLVPLIAHDRAGFGGAICTTGIAVLFCVWHGTPSRNLWQALLLAGSIGFATAILIHPIVGYNDVVHIAPAVAGSLLFSVGMLLSYRPMCVTSKPDLRWARGEGLP